MEFNWSVQRWEVLLSDILMISRWIRGWDMERTTHKMHHFLYSTLQAP